MEVERRISIIKGDRAWQNLIQLLGLGAIAEPCVAVREEWQQGLGCSDVLQAGVRPVGECRAAGL